MNGDLTLTHVHARAVSKMAAFFPAETGQFMDESRTRHNIFVDSRCDSYVLVASLNRSAASPGGEFARVFAVKSPAAPVDRTLLHDRNGTVRFSDEDTTMDFQALVERARGEFLEMPGLQLTINQAARLWGLDTAACQRVIAVLIGSAFLRWTRDGKVARADAGQLF